MFPHNQGARQTPPSHRLTSSSASRRDHQGTTTQPAIAFRVFKELLENKYGEKAKDRIYVTTDKNKSALKKLADEKRYEEFVIPDDVGGRFSVMSSRCKHCAWFCLSNHTRSTF